MFFRGRGLPPRKPDRWPLDDVIFPLTPHDGLTTRQLMEGVMAWGSVGSAKTTCLAHLLLRILEAGWGGMILTAKIEEVAHALALCRAAGRMRDVRLIGPAHPHRINGLKAELDASGHVENLAQMLMVFLETSERRSGGGDSQNRFFQRAALQLARHALTLVTLATGDVTLPVVQNVIQSAPTVPWIAWPDAELTDDQQRQARVWREQSACAIAIRMCEQRQATFTPARAADLAYARAYLLNDWPALAPETRSSVSATLSAITDLFARAPLRELFCQETNLRPEACWEEGLILIHDAPVHRDGDTGLYQQVGWKFLMQKAAMRRDTLMHPRPCFLWEDEFQEFVTRSLDQQFACVSRSTRAAAVRLTQNISNLYAALSNKAEADSLISNHRARFFFACDDVPTCHYGQELSGRSLRRFVSSSMQPKPFEPGDLLWGNTSTWSTSVSKQFEYELQARDFMTLRKGGPHGFAECIVFQGGASFSNGKPYLRCRLPQWFS